ncbi:MAG: hypothetical protein ACO3FI_08800 [Cyclobacteriaceae bacterium]
MNRRLNKIFLLSAVLLFAAASESGAQRVRFFTQFGTSDVGFNQWYQTDGDFTAGLLFPISKNVSFGPVYTFMPNVKYYVFDYKNAAEKTTASRMGGLLRYNIVKLPKFEFYLQNIVSGLSVSYSGLVLSSGGQVPESGKDSALLFGGGAGFIYKVSPGFQINVFDFNISYVDLTISDRKIHKDYRVGLIFQPFRSK